MSITNRTPKSVLRTPNTAEVTQHEEADLPAGVAAKCGSLLEMVSGRTAHDHVVQPHTTDGGPAQTLVLIEDKQYGMQLGDSYPEGGHVHYKMVSVGEGWGARMLLAAGQVIPRPGTPLVSASNGLLRAYDEANDDAAVIVCRSAQALDASGAEEAVYLDVDF